MIGVLRADLSLPGARSLKDRRRVLRSLRDSLRNAFAVSCHELSPSEHPSRGELVVTTAGDDAALIRTTIDRVAHRIRTHPQAIVTRLDSEVFPWHPDDQSWADIASPGGLSDAEPWSSSSLDDGGEDAWMEDDDG